MKRLYGLAVLVLIGLQVYPSVASASQSTLKLQIMPLECTADTVNDGVNQLLQLYPQGCNRIAGTQEAPLGAGRTGTALALNQSSPVTVPPVAVDDQGRVLQNNFEATVSKAIRSITTAPASQYFTALLGIFGAVVIILVVDVFLLEARIATSCAQTIKRTAVKTKSTLKR